MNQETAFLQAMLHSPNDLVLRQVFADWLEERGDPRGELLRLTHALTQSVDVSGRAQMEARMQALVDEGVQAIGPFWSNSIGVRFAWIPPGTFLMGSSKREQDAFCKQFGEEHRDWKAKEVQHEVILTRGYYLGVHPLTQSEWRAMMGNNPGHFKGDDLPVESVSWLDAVGFCNKLSEREGKTPCYAIEEAVVAVTGGNGYRLPTEAEWEYACRGTSTTMYCFGDDVGKLGEYAWYWGTAEYTTHAVGLKKPNGWGLYDMHGNVWEWCQDWYEEDYYKTSPKNDPVKENGGSGRVLRGGDWGYQAGGCSAARRRWHEPGDAYYYLGCRLLAVSSE